MTRKRKPADPADATFHSPQIIPKGPVYEHNRLMPGLRVRHDGWTEARTQRFLDVLGHTGCVTDAARVAGLSRTGARRMRHQFPAFAAAWDDAIARAGQGLIAIAYKRAVEGRETIIIRNGQEHERRISPSDSILGLLLKRSDARGFGEGYAPEDVMNYEEFLSGYSFTAEGKKYQGRHPDETRKILVERFERITARTAERVAKSNTCWHCSQPLNNGARDAMLRHSLALRVALGDVILNPDEHDAYDYTPRKFDD